jgi:hypothetical protein
VRKPLELYGYSPKRLAIGTIKGGRDDDIATKQGRIIGEITNKWEINRLQISLSKK